MVGVAVGSLAKPAEPNFIVSGHFTTNDYVEIVLNYGTKLELYRILDDNVIYIATTELYFCPIALTTIPGCLNHSNLSGYLDALALFSPNNRLIVASATLQGQFYHILLSQIDNQKISNELDNDLQKDANNTLWNNKISGNTPLLSIKLQEDSKKLYGVLLAFPCNYLYVFTIEFGKFVEGDKSLSVRGSHLISSLDSTPGNKLTLPLTIVDCVKVFVNENGIGEPDVINAGPNVVIKSLILVSDNLCAVLISDCPETIGIHQTEGSSTILFFSVSKVNGSLSLLSVRTGLPLDAYNLISHATTSDIHSSFWILVQCHDRILQVNPYSDNGFDVIKSRFHLQKPIDNSNSLLVELPFELDVCQVEILSDVLIAFLPLNSYFSPIVLISLIRDLENKYTCQAVLSLSRTPAYASLWHHINDPLLKCLVHSGSGTVLSVYPIEQFDINFEPTTPTNFEYKLPADNTIYDSEPVTINIPTLPINDGGRVGLKALINGPFITREVAHAPMLCGYLGRGYTRDKSPGKRRRKAQVKIAEGKDYETAKLRSREADPGVFLAIFGPSGVANPSLHAGQCNLIGFLYTQLPLYLVARVDISVTECVVLKNSDAPQVVIKSASNDRSLITFGDELKVSKAPRSTESPEKPYVAAVEDNMLTVYNNELEPVFHSPLNAETLKHKDLTNYPLYIEEENPQAYLVLADELDLGYTLIIATPGRLLFVYRSNTGRQIDKRTVFTLKKFSHVELIPDFVAVSEPLKLPSGLGSILTISTTGYYFQLTASHNDCFLHRIKLPVYPSLRINDDTVDIFSDDLVLEPLPPVSQLLPLDLSGPNLSHLSVSYLGIYQKGLLIFTLDTVTLPITPLNDWHALKTAYTAFNPLLTSADFPYQLWHECTDNDKIQFQLPYDGSACYTKIATSIRRYYLSKENSISLEPVEGSVGKLWACSIGKNEPISKLLNDLLDYRAAEQIDHLHSELGTKLSTSELLAQVEPHPLLLTQLELLSTENNDIPVPTFRVCVGHLASQGIVFGYYELPPFTRVMSVSFGIIGGKEVLLVGTAQVIGEMSDCTGELYILSLMTIFNSPDTFSLQTLSLIQKRQFPGPVMSIKPAGGDLDWPNNPYYNLCLDMNEEIELGIDTFSGTVYLDEVTSEPLDKDAKSSIHALVYSDQFLHSVGSRLFDITSSTFLRGAFGDMPVCIVDISMINNFIVAGDVLKGVGLFMHFGASETRAMCRVAVTNVSTTLPVLSVSATICGNSLAILASDTDSFLHLLSFSLEKAQAAGPDTLVQDKITSSKLLPLSRLELFSRIINLRRINEKTKYAFGSDGSMLKVGIYPAEEIKLYKQLEEVLAGYIDFPMGYSIRPLDNSCPEDSVALNLDTIRHYLYLPDNVQLSISDKIGIKNIDNVKWSTLVSTLISNY